jgi:diapolycopene oxygenase
VLSRIEKALGRDVSGDIRHESILDPPAIAAQTSSHRGSLYGISSNSPGAAFLRHPNRSHRYRGLYFAGGSAHPGGGMPLVMLSGKIAAELVLKNGGRP